MRNCDRLLSYISLAVVGLVLAYNTNFSPVEKVQAEKSLPTIQFNPRGNLSLEIDLNKGVSNVKSDMPIRDVDVTVNHPTKIVEKVVKQPSKKEVIYRTKTEYLEKVVTFPLLQPTIHVPDIVVPIKVEY